MSSEATHWCHTCNRAIQAYTWDMICPRCHGGFVQELNVVLFGARNRNHPMHDVGGFHNHGMGGMGGMVHNMFHNHGMGGMDLHGNLAMHDAGGHGMGMQFPSHGREHFLAYGDGIDEVEMMNLGLDFMDTDGELELEPDPPAAPVRRGDADSLQTVMVTQRQVNDDSNCPICMEEFELNTTVKETPCKHLYHIDCIKPWLQQHTTCPVCRHDLSGNGARDGSNGGTTTNGSTNEIDDVDRGGPNALPWIFTTGLSLVLLLVANLQGLRRPY